MAKFVAAYQKNPWIRHFWEIGGEQIVGPHGPFAVTATAEAVDPEPEPWRIVVAQLIQAVQVKDIASKLPEGRLKSNLVESAGACIETILDDWCGTPPHKPWPWPGPHPLVWDIVSELSAAANTLQSGSLRDGIMDIAVQVIQKANVD